MRALAFAQKKTEALKLINDGEAASLAIQDSWREIADDASEAGLEDIQQLAKKRAASEDTVLATLKKVRTAIVQQQSGTMTHDQLLQFIEDHMATLGGLVSGNKTTGENSHLLRKSRQKMRLSKVLNEKFIEAVDEIDRSRSVFMRFYMDLEALQDICQTEGKDVAAKEIEKVVAETADTVKRLTDARAGITAGLARKSTDEERSNAARDMTAHKHAIDDVLGAQIAEDLVALARHQIMRLMKV